MSHPANVKDAKPTYRSVTVVLTPKQAEALLMFKFLTIMRTYG